MSSYAELLQRPDVRRVLLAQFLGPVGQHAWSVALVLLVLAEFDSPALVGAAALATQVGIFAMPFGGALLARLGQRRTVLVDFLISGAALSAIALLARF